MVADGAATAELLERIASEAGERKCLPVAGCGRWMVADGAATAELLGETEKACPLRKVLSQRTQRFCKNIVAKKFLAEKAEPQRRRDIMIVDDSWSFGG